MLALANQAGRADNHWVLNNSLTLKGLSMKTLLIALIALNSTFALAADKVTKLTLESKGEENVYKQTKLTVKAGSKVELTLKNNSSSMKHNFVLVKTGKEQAVGVASMSVGEAKNYVAESADVLYHTTLVEPKKSGTFTFTAPTEKGTYTYICTFPGHFMTMKGTLTVN